MARKLLLSAAATVICYAACWNTKFPQNLTGEVEIKGILLRGKLATAQGHLCVLTRRYPTVGAMRWYALFVSSIVKELHDGRLT